MLLGQLLRSGGDPAFQIGVELLQFPLKLPLTAGVVKHQHHPGDVARIIANWRCTVRDRAFAAVAGNQQGMIGKAFHGTAGENLIHGNSSRLPCELMHDHKHFFNQPAHRLVFAP
ncbi:MAG: hypothetical protein WD070_05120, partial [Pirellulaceae bacterium]